MRRAFVVAIMILVAAAGCDEEVSTEPDSTVQIDESGDGGDSTVVSDELGANSAADVNGADGDSSAADGEGDTANDDDAAEIVGNADLDLDELAEVAPDIADALDGIDDIVSIGPCRSEFLGLEMTIVPETHECRVLDEVTAGLDGFTLFEPGEPGGIEITIGSAVPGVGPSCELLQVCDSAVPIDLGGDFDVMIADFGGIPLISGTHRNGAVLTVTAFMPLTDADTEFIRNVLDGVEEI